MSYQNKYLRKLSGLASRIRQIFDIKSGVLKSALNKHIRISHLGSQYTFAVPNGLCRHRADTFSYKEPETLAWINKFREESIFWDIGANIGLYSIYAAKKKACRVFSFEPSVFNLEVLARNVSLNRLTSLICLIPVAISEKSGTGMLHMSSTEWGGALSTFDKTFGYDGKELNQVFEYATLSVTLDDAVNKLGLPAPHYLKVDVDGIEHLILSSGPNVLRSLRSVLIEISNDFHEQSMFCKKYLQQAGLVFEDKYLWKVSSKESTNTAGTVNQIWTRE